MTAARKVTDAVRWLRRMSRRHPEWPVVPAAAAAWVFLAGRPHARATGHHHGPTHGGGTDELGLAAMVIAMMLPLMLAGVREAAFSGSWSRRHQGMATFLAGYLGTWMVAMPLIDIAWRQLFAGGTGAAVGTMVVAALWEFAPAKQRRAHRCSAGSSTGTGLLRSGLLAGGRCVASCWALMAVCVAFAHDLRVMAALFCIQLISRLRGAAAPVLSALAVLVVCLASLALRTAGPHAI